MAKIDGRLHINVVGNGPQMLVVFTSNATISKATHPYLTKDTEQLRDDLIRLWQFTEAKADTVISRLKTEREVDLVISLDETYIQNLSPTT